MATETPEQAARRLAAFALAKGMLPIALHTYTDPVGKAIYWCIRAKNPETGEKWIRPMHLNSKGFELGEPKFENGKPIYALDRIAGNPGAVVWIVEGEQKADALNKLGLVATTSGSATSAAAADWEPLRGRTVTIWPDNDDAGKSYAGEVSRILLDMGCTVSCLEVGRLDLGEGEDVMEWLAAHPQAAKSDVEALPKLGAIPDQTNVPAGDSAVAEESFDRLARMTWMEYERVRTPEAKRLGIRRVATLDAEVKRRRTKANGRDENVQGLAVMFQEPEPWPEPVDGAALLEEVADTFKRYAALPHHADTLLALWVVHAHLFDAFEHTPRLNITAPEKGCGKTLLLDILETLTPRAVRADSVTTAVLFRLIDKHAPTLLVDEYDSFLRDNEELRCALNVGHKRGGQHLRCEGDGNEVRAFKTFAPVGLAGIGNLPGTLADRSIVVSMKRATEGEIAERFDSRRTYREHELRRKCARWAADHHDSMRDADPDMPPGFYNRRADNWRALFAIADAAGGDWSARAREAARVLAGTANADDSVRVELLRDIRAAFGELDCDRLSSAQLIDSLTRDPESRWTEFDHGKKITQRQLARLLRSFNIVSASMRLPDGSTPKGYKREAFEDAFTRYLPLSPSTPL